MTKLATNDGVACDLCGLQLRTKFVYYNYDFVKTYVVNKSQPSVFNTPRKVESQIDVCGNCNGPITDDIVKHNAVKFKIAFCELTGKPLENAQPAYMVFISEVSVSIEAKSVKADKNYLSFVMSVSEKSRFEPKPVRNESWETKS
jgi:hypothetical protein